MSVTKRLLQALNTAFADDGPWTLLKAEGATLLVANERFVAHIRRVSQGFELHWTGDGVAPVAIPDGDLQSFVAAHQAVFQQHLDRLQSASLATGQVYQVRRSFTAGGKSLNPGDYLRFEERIYNRENGSWLYRFSRATEDVWLVEEDPLEITVLRALHCYLAPLGF